MNNFEGISYENDDAAEAELSKSDAEENNLDAVYDDKLIQNDEELLEYTTQAATTEKQTKAPKLKYVKTKVVESGKYTGAWPSTAELPKSQRRDTSCPMTLVKERMNIELDWF